MTNRIYIAASCAASVLPSDLYNISTFVHRMYAVRAAKLTANLDTAGGRARLEQRRATVVPIENFESANHKRDKRPRGPKTWFHFTRTTLHGSQ